MAKKCIEDRCRSDQFGGGYCAYHQWLRKRQGGDLYNPKPKVKKHIPKESVKRKVENKQYFIRVKEFWDNAVNNETNRCFFCDEYMDHRENIHHLLGRGSIVLEEQWWVLCHQECHMAYHFTPIEKLMEKPWFKGWLARVKGKEESQYWKELKKIEKANEELF